MAVVPNKDGAGITANGHMTGPIDRPFCNPNRAGAGAAAGASLYAGEIMLNTTTFDTYRAAETNTTTWVLRSIT